MSLLLTSSAAEGFLSTPDSAQVRAIARLQGGDELGPFGSRSLIGMAEWARSTDAWDTRLDRQVAIKVLPQVSPIDDAGRERFEAEAGRSRILSDPPRRSGGPFSVGSESVIAYRSASPNSRLSGSIAQGASWIPFAAAADHHHPRLSPDEKSMLIEKTDPSTGRHTIWVLDLLRGTTSRADRGSVRCAPTRLVPGRSSNCVLVESSRRARLVHGAIRRFEAAEPVLPGEKSFAYIADWSRDGHYLLPDRAREQYGSRDPCARRGSAAANCRLCRQGNTGTVLPDGAWIAYTRTSRARPRSTCAASPTSGPSGGSRRMEACRSLARRRQGALHLATDGKLMAIRHQGLVVPGGHASSAVQHRHRGIVRRPLQSISGHARRSARPGQPQRRGRELRADHGSDELGRRAATVTSGEVTRSLANQPVLASVQACDREPVRQRSNS